MTTKVDPPLAHLLTIMNGPPPAEKPADPVDAKRRGMRQLVAELNKDRPLPTDVDVRDIPLDNRMDVVVRLYTPSTPIPGDFPLLVYFHGGGWVIGGIDTHDVQCRELASRSACIVALVAYRLAPEHPFPAAYDDAWAAVTALARDAAKLGANPDRIAVGGDSSGGNLAAVVARRARDEGGPALCLQLLICPGTDLVGDHPSRVRLATGYLPSEAEMAWFLEQYLPAGMDRKDPRISPLHATDLSGLPPAIMVTAGFDPLCDEGIAYADRLAAAGSRVARLHYPTLIHGFNVMDNISPAAAQALGEIADHVGRAMER